MHLRAVEGLSYREIAEVLGTSVEAIGMRILRGRQQLRKSLGRGRHLIWLVGLPWISEQKKAHSAANVAESGKCGFFATVTIVSITIAMIASLALRGVPEADRHYIGLLAQEPSHEHSHSKLSRRTGGTNAPTKAPKSWARVQADYAVGESPIGEGWSTVVKTVQGHGPQKGEASMKLTTSGTVSLLLALGLGAQNYAADIGDVNDDGRVSFADGYLFALWSLTGDEAFRPATGSADFEPVIGCTADPTGSSIPEFLFLEALRRSSVAPLPHFIERWPDDGVDRTPAPPTDPRVRLEILDMTHSDGTHGITIQVNVTASETIDGLSVVLRSEHLDLRPPIPMRAAPTPMLVSSTEFYLVTQGSLVYRSELDPVRPLGIGPGETTFPLYAELPQGTLPGVYRIELLAGTEAVTALGEVIRPEVASGTLDITDLVVDAPKLPFPPLQLLDTERRRIEGGIELRVTEGASFPGDEALVTVQVKAERPVNFLPFVLQFDGRTLAITDV